MGTKYAFIRTHTAVAIVMMWFFAFSARAQFPHSSSPVTFFAANGKHAEKPSRNSKDSAMELSGKLPMSFKSLPQK